MQIGAVFFLIIDASEDCTPLTPISAKDGLIHSEVSPICWTSIV
jgi:hypothetical protein